MGRITGSVRLTHPFPSILDGLVVAAAAWYVGGAGPTVIRLAAAMVALQASIGILNDIVDAPRDVGRVPPKPIPAGQVGIGQAFVMASLAAGLGIGLSIPSGPPLVAIAVLVLAIGYGYDLRLKGTAWSWLPFAVGIPLLPVFGWVGVTGGLPAGSGIVIVAAMVAGAGLAISNARADFEQDQASGTRSVVTALGLERSWWLASGLFAVAAMIVLLGLLGTEGSPPMLTRVVVLVGLVAVALGALIGRRGSPKRRERAWECQAIGVAVLAVGYLAVQATAS